MGNYSSEEIWSFLHEVKDPEVPVLDIVELGVVREVSCEDDRVLVRITPTYTGCPAMRVMEEGIRKVLRRRGVKEVMIETVYAPAWTTDWMSEESRARLKEYGIAPPGKVEEEAVFSLREAERTIPCPFCDSQNTRLTSQFGSTACKALYYCHACHQPFEHFKCH